LAKRLIADTCAKQDVQPGTLTIHADRGSSMTSKPSVNTSKAAINDHFKTGQR
jgi:hypothetical protein